MIDEKETNSEKQEVETEVKNDDNDALENCPGCQKLIYKNEACDCQRKETVSEQIKTFLQ